MANAPISNSLGQKKEGGGSGGGGATTCLASGPANTAIVCDSAATTVKAIDLFIRTDSYKL